MFNDDPKSKRFRDYNSYLREVFGCRVQKITVDAGLTCPNRDGTKGTGGCIYCNAKGSGTGAARRGLSLKEQIQMGKAGLARRYKVRKFLAYFQSFSNTYAPLPKLKAIYEEALEDPDIVGLTIGTRPDCLSEEVLDLLRDKSLHRPIWLELGLQSAHDSTLSRIGRGHDLADFVDAVKRARSRDIPVCAHVILGLPGEGRREMLETAEFLSCADIQAVKIHLLYVIRGTELARWYERGEYRCLSREEYVSVACRFLCLLPPDMIIQRITGDPHPEEILAPLWALEKQENLKGIQDYLKAHDLYQGKHYRSSQGRVTHPCSPALELPHCIE